MMVSAAASIRLVLVVEEETHERVAIAEHLREAGHDVRDASTTDEALKQLEGAAGIGAVVTDAHVPGIIDGYELARLVRERWPAVAVVLTSGHSDASSGPVPEGAAFVSKPYLFEHLVPPLGRLAGAPRA